MEKLNINQWAKEDRPREKMAYLGTEALSNAELLAILIGSGSTDESAVTLMKRVLADCNNNLNSLGKKTLHDIGSQFTIDLMWKFTDQINWKMRIYGFTTYKRAEFEWENTFVFKFNRYISTNVFIYPRFDDGVARDGHHGYWQLKEFASVGFAYSF